MSFGVERLDIDWIGNTSYSPEMVTVGVSIPLNKYLSISTKYGVSNSSSSSLKSPVYIPPENTYISTNAKAKIKYLTNVSLVYTKNISNRLSLGLGVGYMDYDQEVTNFKYENYSNRDSGISYSLKFNYLLNSGWKIGLGYDLYHDKTKWKNLEVDGSETTESFGLSVSIPIKF